MSKNILSLILFLGLMAFWAGACGSGPDQAAEQTLTVSAAVSLTDVFNDLGRKFEARHPGVKVVFNFASSGDLEKQIVAGAPVDVFAAASMKETDDLAQKGMLAAGTLKMMAGNDLVMVVPSASNLNIASVGDLVNGEVKKIAIGNPETVPAGRYAKDAVSFYGIWNVLQPKLIPCENVRQVLDYVARGEVDAGLVYATDAATRRDDVKTALTIPDGSHKPIVYPAAVIAGAKDESLARQFVDFAASDDGRSVFESYGFRTDG